MREDEFKQLKEQRMQLVTELRSFSDAMQERASENNGKILAEDQEEYDKREKDLIEINRGSRSRTAHPAGARAQPGVRAEVPGRGRADDAEGVPHRVRPAA